jgi:hypothetical protein
MSLDRSRSSGASAMSRGGDFDHAPLLMKIVFAGAGVAIMLLALGVIPADPGKFHAPHWVVFIFGLMFFLAAVLMLIGQHRFLHPAIYMFVAAIMSSALAAVFCWVTLWSTGPFGGGFAIGPITLRMADSSDIPARVMFGAVALIALVIAGLGWWRWWRALRGLPVDLSS